MPTASTLLLAFLAMVLFAANSLLCRAALGGHAIYPLGRSAIDPASFTALRIASGALATWGLVRLRRGGAGAPARAGSWPSAVALFAYAACFSYAYLALPAGLGVLVLFPAVQGTMVVGGLLRGERVSLAQVAGLILALGGLVLLVRPGSAHGTLPFPAAALMLAAGGAWGVYSLRGMGSPDPGGATAGNFLRAVPLALGLCLAGHAGLRLDAAGFGYAVASGAVASGLGYVLWYRTIQGLRAAAAAGVQLSVPVLASLGGVALLGEAFTPRMVLASAAILGGITLALQSRAGKAG
jgi:drug/metabolite transporter (DMT)-like permease